MKISYILWQNFFTGLRAIYINFWKDKGIVNDKLVLVFLRAWVGMMITLYAVFLFIFFEVYDWR